MTKHKVSELEGTLLDAAVAMAEGYVPDANGYRYEKPPVLTHGVMVLCYVLPGDSRDDSGYPSRGRFHPSGDWRHGGPIIEREQISIETGYLALGSEWRAVVGDAFAGNWPTTKPVFEGPTPLISAMRAYVESKFGDEVDLPAKATPASRGLL